TGHVRTRRWPFTVISSGSPGPAPMKYTVIEKTPSVDGAMRRVSRARGGIECSEQRGGRLERAIGIGQCRSAQHHDRQPALARDLELRFGRAAAAVLADDDIDPRERE